VAQKFRRQGFEWRYVRVAALGVAGLLLLSYAVLRVGAIFDVFADRLDRLARLLAGVGRVGVLLIARATECEQRSREQ